ncbi:hypothetical protein CHUAL_013888 [Chamberlinius hualienensis]
MHSSPSVQSSVDATTKRTPGAWRTREQNLIHQQSHQQMTLNQSQLPPCPPSRNSITTTTTNATGDETSTSSEIETSESSRRRYNRLVPRNGVSTNTLRSTCSVPVLNVNEVSTTWNGEPCPVHGGIFPPNHEGSESHHRPHHHAGLPLYPAAPPPPPPQFIYGNPYGTISCISGNAGRMYPTYKTMRKAGSMLDLRLTPRMHMLPPLPLPPPGTQTLEKKSIYGSESNISFSPMLHSVPIAMTPVPPPYTLPPMPPPHLLPPGMRPRPMVIPASAEPLPVRDPNKSKTQSIYSGLGSTTNLHVKQYKEKKKIHCCKGPLPLIWFIICIVTMGVLLGVVLGIIYG